MILKAVAANFLIITMASPGVNELYPCFQYGQFELEENDIAPVLEGILKRFENEGWTCRSLAFPVSITCERGSESLRTRAVCETAITNTFRYYFFMRKSQEAEPEDYIGELSIGLPVNDEFDFHPTDNL